MKILNNGAEVIAQKGNLVLAKFRGDFVTWQTKNNEAFHGHYFGDDIVAASLNFAERCKDETKVTDEKPYIWFLIGHLMPNRDGLWYKNLDEIFGEATKLMPQLETELKRRSNVGAYTVVEEFLNDQFDS